MVLLNLFLLITLYLFNHSSAGNIQPINPQDSLKIIEKVFLHIDREIYSPGEDLWYKAYLVEGKYKMLTSHSNNLHVDLISPDSKIIESQIVKLSRGLGNGDFKLPGKLSSGKYQIRAYTNYMRNFGEEMFFKKNFTVINTDNPKSAIPDSAVYIKNKPEISFFPEGGSMVDDVTSLVGFKAVNATGKGCEISGKVYTSTGDTIASFCSTFKGMGTFYLKPFPGEQYYSIIHDNKGDSAKTLIPKSLATGMVLHVSATDSGELDLVIRTNKETLPLLTDHDLSLTISVHNTILKTIFFRVNSLNSHMTLKTDEFPDGIVSLTIYDPEGNPYCERLAFIHNNDNEELTLKTDKPDYATRDSVSVIISLSGSAIRAQNAFLSLSAANEISAEGADLYPSNISSWFLLESDVRGDIETPSYYFDRSITGRLKNLDILLLTQGWRDFKWKYEENYFQTENGFTISGRVRKKLVNEPLGNSTVTLGLFEGKRSEVYLLPVDSSGRFLIRGIDFTGKTNLIASVTNDKDKLKGWLILDSINYIPEEVPNKNVNIGKVIIDRPVITDSKAFVETNNFLKYSKNNNQRKIYRLSDTIDIGVVSIRPRPRIEPYTPKVQNEINLRTLFADKEVLVTDELEIYNTLGQLLSIKLHIYYNDEPMVSRVGSSSGNAFLTTQMPGRPSCNKMTNPLTMLNGMEVKYDAIIFIPVSWVERIDVLCPIRGELEWGERGGNGVVSILLKDDFFMSSTIPTYHSVNKSITGYNEARIFYSPKHHSSLKNDIKPDLRTTLFWEPNIEIENNKNIILNYYNSDNSSTVKVTIEGITSDGIPITASTEYEVK
jgi:hypothetical protein